MIHAIRALGVVAVCALASGCFCIPDFSKYQYDAGQFQPPDGGLVYSADGGTGCAEPWVLQKCFDWRCSRGILSSRSPSQDQEGEIALPVSGTVLSSDYATITFSVKQDGSATVATFSSEGCNELTVRVIDADNATMTWNGVTFTGKGELSAEQKVVLAQLNQSHLVQGLVQAPLELGCMPDVPDVAEAALLFPWQVLLKYDPTPATRTAGLTAIAADSRCKYFNHRRDLQNTYRFDGGADGPRLGPLQFSPSDNLPNVFGQFALDAVGATEAKGQPLEGDLTGPCGALCRGACGPDCPDTCATKTYTECSSDGGVDQTVTSYRCGVHDGCVEHDNCYDDCYKTNDCGSWGAAFCRRGCDKQAVSHYSVKEGKSWARGGGPYQRFVTFDYRTPDPGACTCVAPGTAVTLDDGAARAIEDLNVGDGILAFDLDAGVVVKARVERLLVHHGDYSLDRLTSSGGEELEITANHPVFTARGFVHTEDLVVGDTVYVVDHQLLMTRAERLVAITRRQSRSDVTYNIKTTAGNYFAQDLLIHNKCLAADSRVETARGLVPVADVRPGDLVKGRDLQTSTVWTPVLAVYRKTTVLPALPGKRVGDALRLTDNHVLAETGLPAGQTAWPSVDIAGPVFDLETGTGNYLAGGVLLEAAHSAGRNP